MGSEAFKIKPLKAIRSEFETFPQDLHKAYGNQPGKAILGELRGISVNVLNTISPLAFLVSLVELYSGPVSQHFRDLTQSYSFKPLRGTLLLTGRMASEDNILPVSYFTTFSLITGLATALLSKLIAPHPQNEQRRTLNAIHHLWGELAKALPKDTKNDFNEASLTNALNYIAALESQRENHPKEFKHSLRPISARNLDKNQLTKFKGLICLYLYNLTTKESHLHSSLESFQAANALDKKGQILGWFNEQMKRESLQKEKESTALNTDLS